jgi:hypothetical protein
MTDSKHINDCIVDNAGVPGKKKVVKKIIKKVVRKIKKKDAFDADVAAENEKSGNSSNTINITSWVDTARYSSPTGSSPAFDSKNKILITSNTDNLHNYVTNKANATANKQQKENIGNNIFEDDECYEHHNNINYQNKDIDYNCAEYCFCDALKWNKDMGIFVKEICDYCLSNNCIHEKNTPCGRCISCMNDTIYTYACGCEDHLNCSETSKCNRNDIVTRRVTYNFYHTKHYVSYPCVTLETLIENEDVYLQEKEKKKLDSFRPSFDKNICISKSNYTNIDKPITLSPQSPWFKKKEK